MHFTMFACNKCKIYTENKNALASSTIFITQNLFPFFVALFFFYSKENVYLMEATKLLSNFISNNKRELYNCNVHIRQYLYAVVYFSVHFFLLLLLPAIHLDGLMNGNLWIRKYQIIHPIRNVEFIFYFCIIKIHLNGFIL